MSPASRTGTQLDRVPGYEPGGRGLPGAPVSVRRLSGLTMHARRLMVVTTTVASLALHACGGGGGGGGPSNTSDPCEVASLGSANAAFSAAGIFNVSPILIGAISFITPLGNLNPPNAHVYPTDHMFLLPTNTAAGANVVSAAAAGKIVQLFQPAGAGGDWKMVVQVDSSFVYYYDHITPAGGVAVGSTLNAGQAVGTNSGAAAAVDFGV